jgi:hypothetical protein
LPKIEIINPLPGGMRFTSPDRADHFCRLGMATMSHDGRLLFKDSNQIRIANSTFNDEFTRNRGGVLYWNGARSHYVNDKDTAMFPPCCNVVFPKIGTVRAARRYRCSAGM